MCPASTEPIHELADNDIKLIISIQITNRADTTGRGLAHVRRIPIHSGLFEVHLSIE